MKNSFVAFFDILGFKNLVEKNSHEDLMKIYQELLYESIDNTEKLFDPIYKVITPILEKESLIIKTYIISDSIILIQNTLTERGLLNLIAKSRVLLSVALGDGIPLRGAISYGPITVLENKNGTTIVGLGLTKAYAIESTQQWSGGIVDSACFDLVAKNENPKLVDRLLSDKKNAMITKYNAPLKDLTSKEELVFDWTNYDLIKDENTVRGAFAKHNKEISNEKVQLMIENTVAFYRKMRIEFANIK